MRDQGVDDLLGEEGIAAGPIEDLVGDGLHLLAAAEAEREASKLAAVPFSHLAHERALPARIKYGSLTVLGVTIGISVAVGDYKGILIVKIEHRIFSLEKKKWWC